MTSQQSDSQSGHAFLCYVREDSESVDQLQRDLHANGIPVWRDTSKLWPGEDWRAAIRHAISSDSLAFIACFSANGVRLPRSYQNEELLLAIDQLRLRPPGQSWLIPVRFSDCQLPGFDLGAGRTLDSLQAIDLFGPRRVRNLSRLISAVLRIFGTERIARAHLDQAQELHGEGHLAEAEPLYREAIELARATRPDEGRNLLSSAYQGLAQALVSAGRADEAEAVLRAAISLEPGDPGLRSCLGLALHDQGRYWEAETADRDSVRLDPRWITGYLQLGNDLRAQRRFTEAAAAYSEAIRIDPANALAHAELKALAANNPPGKPRK